MFKISGCRTAVDSKIINFSTDSHTRVDFKVLSLIVKLTPEQFHVLLVMSTVGMPCQIHLDVHRHSGLLSVYCVHVLLILYRFTF